MNLRTVLLATCGVAAGVIALTAAVVLTGSKPMAKPAATRFDATAVEAAQALPDPAARGVIIAAADSYYYWLDPSGKRETVWQRPYPQDGVSTDGRWRAGINWADEEAFLVIIDLNEPDYPENMKEVHLPASLVSAEWAPASSQLAALDEDGLYLVDPASGEAGLVAENVTAYAWGAGDRLLYATQDESRARLVGLDAAGHPVELARLGSPIDRFYVSPERDQLLYTQGDVLGWRLLSVDPAGYAIRDYGNLGRAWMRDYGDSGFAPVSLTATVEAPELAVAWSPRGDMFAVGPVSKPYVMHVIAPASKWEVRSYTFGEGYAGELSWSPDGTRLAISTYSLDRTQHEVYVMDVAAGTAPRHLLDGCQIVWSPDGEFVAVKREPQEASGVAAIRVDTGYHWALTTLPQFVPLAWGEDRDAALALTINPVPYAVQLGK